MSKLKADLTRKKLKKILEIAELEPFLKMIWSVDAITTNNSNAALPFFNFSAQVTDQRIESDFHVPRWMLETLLNEILATPLKKVRRKTLNCNEWAAFEQVYDKLRQLEDDEGMLGVPSEDIIESIPRITWRQFPWQIGYSNSMEIYRAWRLYGTVTASSVLKQKTGLDFDEISRIGCLFYLHFRQSPIMRRDIDLTNCHITDETRDKIFSMLSRPSQVMQSEARLAKSETKAIAYRPSILRRFPLIEFGKESTPYFFCPIPDLLLLRITSGLFYDIVGNDRARNAAAASFEEYIQEITRFYLQPQSRVDGEFEYKNPTPKKSTDMIVCSKEGDVEVIVECKALNLKMSVRQSANPWETHPEAFRELIKGVLQIWRFCYQIHLGKFPIYSNNISNTVGVVLTLHPWMEGGSKAREEIMKLAKRKAIEENIPVAAQTPISFIASTDWEESLRTVPPITFLEALHHHTAEENSNKRLGTVANDIGCQTPHARVFPYFDKLSEVAPWLGQSSNGEE